MTLVQYCLGGSGNCKRTGVAYDPLMLKHTCLCGDELSHPESPARLERIIAKIADSGALARSDDSKILMRYIIL